MTPTTSLINYLFDKFSIIWDRKWADKIDGVEAKKREVWGNAIAGMTRKQIDIGIKNASRQLIWPPEIAEFIKLCTNENDKPEPAKQRNVTCSYRNCPNDGTMSRDMRGDGWLCNKHWSEGK